MIFIPKSGKKEVKSGKIAQCMAQATEAVIPKASQLIRIRIGGTKLAKSNNVAKSFWAFYVIVISHLFSKQALVTLRFKCELCQRRR
jgi:hypothetical protein